MKLIKTVITAICFLLLFSLTVGAAQSTSYTYTFSVEDEWIRTQDAYVPSRIFLRNDSLSNPQDIFIKEKNIFVADTGNKRIVIYNYETEEISSFEYDEFVFPCGIFIDENYKIYVADSEAGKIFIFDKNFSLIDKIGKPESILYSKDKKFMPKKIAVSSQGNIFVVGEGSFEGIMQFDQNYEFQGYFATNKRNLTAFERIQQLILNEEQLESLAMKMPLPIQNISITDKDLLYSVTQSAEGGFLNQASIETKTENCLKLHNMAGTNILSSSQLMKDEWNFVDVVSGNYGNVYTITATGLIYEYDSEGNLLFSFAGRALENDAYGLISIASAIDMDERGILYVLDSERAIIQTFVPTDFATLTHKAIYQMNKGDYSSAESTWQEILKMNGMSKIAHVGYGRTLLRQQKYKEALSEFRFANDRTNYSECYWELRDKWLTDNMAWFIVIAMLICVFLIVFKRKKSKPLKSSDILYQYSPSDNKVYGELKFSLSVFKHPIDCYYYLKSGIRGSIVSANIIYLLLFFVFASDNLFKSFIFNTGKLANSPMLITVLYFSILILWILGNYMVSTINEGEGSLKNVFIITAYSFIPYLVITPFKIIFTYALTQNESFVITLLTIVSITWSAILLFIGLMRTHNYSFMGTVKNIILSLIAMIIAIVAVAIIYLLWTKITAFMSELFLEVSYLV